VNLSNFSFFFPFLKEKRNHFCIDNYPLDRVVGYCQYFSLFLINISSWDLLKLSWFRIVRKKKKKTFDLFCKFKYTWAHWITSPLPNIYPNHMCQTIQQIRSCHVSLQNHYTFWPVIDIAAQLLNSLQEKKSIVERNTWKSKYYLFRNILK
jgi:hypothetical protein